MKVWHGLLAAGCLLAVWQAWRERKARQFAEWNAQREHQMREYWEREATKRPTSLPFLMRELDEAFAVAWEARH